MLFIEDIRNKENHKYTHKIKLCLVYTRQRWNFTEL